MEPFTILIVDDDADQAQNLQDIFEAEGYSTKLASNGQMALAFGKEKAFGLGLIDIGLPDIPGVELIERLAGVSPEMEYIIITGQASLQTAVQAVGLKNIVAYETKPPNLDYLLALVRQVTERKRAEETLKESELFNANLLNNSPLPQLVLNPDTSIKYVNPAFEKLTGYSLAEVRGLKTPHPWMREEVAEEAVKKTKEMMDFGLVGLEALLRKKNGELFWVEVTATPVFENGKLSYLLANWTNITERKLMEKQLRHSQVLTSLGEMTAGIAHEVGNPLASIVLYSEVAMKGNDIPRQTKKDLKIIHDEAKRAGKLMKDLLAYSRKLEPNMRRVNLNAAIEKVIELRRYQLNVQDVKITTDLLKGTLNVNGDSSQLTQVFMNLILNAEEALKGQKGGNITVKSSVEGEWVSVAIIDDGPGIPKENLDQIFMPFFTTKGVGEGTGLGLSTCYGIIAAHGGVINAANNEESGATFTVQLPLMGKERRKTLPLETE